MKTNSEKILNILSEDLSIELSKLFQSSHSLPLLPLEILIEISSYIYSLKDFLLEILHFILRCEFDDKFKSGELFPSITDVSFLKNEDDSFTETSISNYINSFKALKFFELKLERDEDFFLILKIIFDSLKENKELFSVIESAITWIEFFPDNFANSSNSFKERVSLMKLNFQTKLQRFNPFTFKDLLFTRVLDSIDILKFCLLADDINRIYELKERNLLIGKLKLYSLLSKKYQEIKNREKQTKGFFSFFSFSYFLEDGDLIDLKIEYDLLQKTILKSEEDAADLFSILSEKLLKITFDRMLLNDDKLNELISVYYLHVKKITFIPLY